MIRRPSDAFRPPTVVGTTLKSFDLTPQEVTAIMALPVSDPVRIALVKQGATAGTSGGSTYGPANGYVVALRSSQGGFSNLLDQSPVGLVLPVNPALFPVAWAASQAVTTGNYRTPSVMNGLIYKVTTAGTNAASEPTWNTTIGGTTTSGSAVYTTEKGPWTVDGGGVRSFRSLASAQTGAAASYQVPAAKFQWNMNGNQSLIVRGRLKQDWNATGQAAASPILSNCLNGTGGGFRWLATASGVQDIRVQVRDGASHEVLSGNMAPGFARAPVNGVQHDVLMLIDPLAKLMFFAIDNVFMGQSDMIDANNACPNGLNLASIVGSTQGDAFTVGGDPGSSTTFLISDLPQPLG